MTDIDRPRPLSFPPHATAETRLLAFFGHLDCRVYLGQAFVDVGAGSINTPRRILNIPPSYKGSLGRIGRFVEIAECDLHFAGDHRNDQPVNVVFGNVAMLWQAAINAGLDTRPGPGLAIGNGVVVSQRAQILPGVEIADGCVIGAGAIVTRSTEPFGIYAGVPARRISDRFDAATAARVAAACWWDFTPAFLAANMGRIQTAALEEGDYRPQRPRYVLAMDSAPGARVIGFVDDSGEHLLDAAPARARAYAEQTLGEGPFHWLADPWS
jgi:hypothetical protein